MKIIHILFISLLFLLSTPLYAYDGITFYGTEISNKDRFNSNGDRLTSVRDILRQDRANYYLFDLRDAVDQGDGYFSSKSRRALFDTARIEINPGLAKRIVYGSGPVLITVFVLTPHRIEVQAGLPTPGVD